MNIIPAIKTLSLLEQLGLVTMNPNWIQYGDCWYSGCIWGITGLIGMFSCKTEREKEREERRGEKTRGRGPNKASE